MYDDPNIIARRKERTAREVARTDNAYQASRRLKAEIERRRDDDANRGHLTDGQRRRLDPEFQSQPSVGYGPDTTAR